MSLVKPLEEKFAEVPQKQGVRLVKSPKEIESSMSKTTIIKRLSEILGGLIGYVKGENDSKVIQRLLDYKNITDYNMVDLSFEKSLGRIVDLPLEFGGSSPLIPIDKEEWWWNLCESLGITAQKVGPLAGLTLGLAGGAIISSAVGYIKDKRILKDMKKILTPADYSKANKFTKIKVFTYAIKSLGLGFMAYLTIKFVYSFISTLLGLNNVPDVINTVEEANFWARFVYDTIMTAKDLAPIAEYWAPKLLVGAAGTYAAGTVLENYANKKIKNILEKYKKNL